LNPTAEGEPTHWFDEHDAFCLIAGGVPGNLEMLHFDLGGEAFEPWYERVEQPPLAAAVANLHPAQVRSHAHAGLWRRPASTWAYHLPSLREQRAPSGPVAPTERRLGCGPEVAGRGQGTAATLYVQNCEPRNSGLAAPRWRGRIRAMASRGIGPPLSDVLSETATLCQIR